MYAGSKPRARATESLAAMDAAFIIFAAQKYSATRVMAAGVKVLAFEAFASSFDRPFLRRTF